ncbi:gliding motility lipoprotein GldB [Pedobacter faecalis]|uniref:gliding motility lipoprotein GldB n=1 Tax=Pedobacter faecalis TaxID=3041495 RepID=UPI00254D853F|nr:gliding motility lipoprotein GldB [Pedobacter sp. ELA7]
MQDKLKTGQSYLFFLLIGVLLLVSCKQDKRPDVSAVKIDLQTMRFDRDLYSARNVPPAKADAALKAKYGNFYNDFVFRMVGNQAYTGPEILNMLFKDRAYSDLQHEVDSIFPDIKKYDNELHEAFTYIKYYYPKVNIPRIIYFTSGFAVQTPVGDNYLGVGLDMFLGKNSKFYGAIVQSVPTYLSRRFTPDYLASRVVETFIREELFPERDEDHSFLDKMVHHGKILYFMDNVLPEDVADTIKIGYTGRQLDWCKTFERDIWAYYLENEFLYETDYHKIQVLLAEGPFTPGLGERNESAPKIGVWTGWQIVRKYMSENAEVSLQQLMAETDAQKILKLSRYKPK